MLKRTAILALWFYAGWTFGALLSWAIGIPEIVGPVLGAALALVVAVDPRRLSSTRTSGGRDLSQSNTALGGS